MQYAVDFKPSARKDLKALPKGIQRIVLQHIESLADDPRPPWAGVAKGELRDLWKFRVGDYRVVYRIEDDQLVVLVVAVGDRKEIYRRLLRMKG